MQSIPIEDEAGALRGALERGHEPIELVAQPALQRVGHRRQQELDLVALAVDLRATRSRNARGGFRAGARRRRPQELAHERDGLALGAGRALFDRPRGRAGRCGALGLLGRSSRVARTAQPQPREQQRQHDGERRPARITALGIHNAACGGVAGARRSRSSQGSDGRARVVSSCEGGTTPNFGHKTALRPGRARACRWRRRRTSHDARPPCVARRESATRGRQI